MSWYYNRQTLIGDSIFEATGWQKWATDREVDLEKAAAAAGVPQMLFGPFATRPDAETFRSAHPGPQAGAAAVGQGVTDVGSALNTFTKTLAQIYLRTAEIAVGIVLLAVALNAILKQTTGVNVAATAKRAGVTAARVVK